MKISEVVIDNRNGIGATPYNQEVNYRGLRVQMKPSVFLDLAAFLRSDDRNRHVTQAILDGVAIGAPFLIIQIPAAWFDSQDYSEPAQIVGHEGRNRMQSVQDAEGNAAIETHLFFRDDIRNRDLTPEIIEALSQGMYMERTSTLKRGPLFKRMVNEGVGRITPQNVTQDVGLNQTSIEAEKFGNKVNRDGYPALLMRKKKKS